MNQSAEALNRDLRNRRVQRGASIFRNSLWNFAGQIAPLLLAAFAIPILIRRLGVDRFGVLTLAWILVGYFSLFDLGIGRAITKLLAEKIALHEFEAASNLIWTAIFSMLLLGVCFGGVFFAFAPWLSQSVLKIPSSLHGETLRTLPWLASAVPFVTLTCGLRGMLEAQQDFAAVNTLRGAMGLVTYVGPLSVLPFSRSIFPVVLTLVAARVLNCGFHFWVCQQRIPAFSRHVTWNRQAFRALLGFGSWLTVSNIISPMMVYFDRFLIGSLISISAVAYYAAPFDAVTKLWLIPSSLAGVLFPAFSEALAVDNHDRASSLYERSIAGTFAVLLPLILGIVLFAPEGLRLWLGATFANRSSVVLQILAIGIFTNSLANMPYALLQASGRPDLTAKLHLIEVPCYLGLLYWAIQMHGIEGAALAWTCRLTVEAAVLFFLLRSVLATRLWITIIAGTAALVIACTIAGLLFKVLFLVASLSIFACTIWRWIFDDFLRLRLRSWMKTRPVLAKAKA